MTIVRLIVYHGKCDDRSIRVYLKYYYIISNNIISQDNISILRNTLDILKNKVDNMILIYYNNKYRKQQGQYHEN